MKKIIKIISLYTLFAVLTACGQDAKPLPKSSNNLAADGTVQEVPCTKTECPAVQLQINATPIQNGALYGTLDQSTPWTIAGVALGGSKRNVQMKAYNPPKGGEFLGQGSLSITAQYGGGVLESTQSSQPIEVVLRDISRCEFENPKYLTQCRNLDQKGLEKFEQRASIPWVIALGDPNAFTDPTFSQLPDQKLGANSGMTGCMDGFASGGLSGIVSGNILGGILGGAVGCLGNSVQTLGK